MCDGFRQWAGLACGCKARSAQDGVAMVGPTPIVKRVVLVGGGHAHVQVVKMFGMHPMPGVEVVLVSRDIESPYSGMLPGFVAGLYSHAECHIDAPRLARFANATFVHAEVTHIDTEQRLVVVKGPRPPIPYDVLSVNIGITPSMTPTVANPNVTPVKPIESFGRRWQAIIDRVLQHGNDNNNDNNQEGAPQNTVRLVVVGGGAGGVELCLAMQARLRKEIAQAEKSTVLKVTLVTRSPKVMQDHNAAVRRMFERILVQRGVEVRTGCAVVAARDHTLECDNGPELDFDECVWCTQASAQEWLSKTNLQLEKGFIALNDTLESVNVPGVFGAGDVAAVLKYPRPKAGVFAVRQGMPLYHNIRRYLLGQPLKPFHPQLAFLALVGTGDPELCVLSRGPLAFQGAWCWKMKDWIDRKFMAQFAVELPFDEMAARREAQTPSRVVQQDDEALRVVKEAAMRCGGCGSKVGETVLSSVMAAVAPSVVQRDDVLVGLNSPDDCAIVSVGNGAVCLTVDFFRAIVSDPFVFGRIAANHALSDCHAMGVAPQSAMAIAVVPYAKEFIVQSNLHQLMAGACVALQEVGCALVGGHTCEGAEMALGFSVTGVLGNASEALSKGGMQQTNALILTKPVGTGTLLAGDMRGKARGVWVTKAIESMVQSNHVASQVFKTHGATACTDVTGFGLVGHLTEMCKASGMRATVRLPAVPVLDGAQHCINEGVFSSLHPSNFRLRRAVANHDEVRGQAAYPLLFDPQTAGGLLAAVPAAAADQCVQALRDAGYERACVVGEVAGPSEGIPAVVDVVV